MVASPVNLTDNAKNYLQNTAINSGKEYVWFGVEGGGCTGFQYKWDFIDDPDPSDYKLSIGHDPSDMREIFLIVTFKLLCSLSELCLVSRTEVDFV